MLTLCYAARDVADRIAAARVAGGSLGLNPGVQDRDHAALYSKDFSVAPWGREIYSPFSVVMGPKEQIGKHRGSPSTGLHSKGWLLRCCVSYGSSG